MVLYCVGHPISLAERKSPETFGDMEDEKACRILAAAGSPSYYAAFFFAALNFAHRAFCAAAIFLRADADMVRLAGAEPVVFATAVGCDCFRMLAHRAFCARAILRREAADIIRFGWVALLDAPVPFNDSIPEIIWSNLSISTCAWLRFSRSSRSALSKFNIVTPSGILMRTNCIRVE